MGELGEFLKHLPDAAKSPLAFVAYGLVLAAWLVRSWLLINPQRQARQILEQFKDDQKRLKALVEVFHEQPPRGLAGNDAILEWVRLKSGERTKFLLLVAWLATAVAILLFLVAIRNQAGTTETHQVTILLHRLGTAGDCPALPVGAHLVASSGNDRLADARVTENCKALLATSVSSGAAVLSLLDAGVYRLADAKATYPLASNTWDVYLTSVEPAKLQLTLFQYSSVDCPDARTAFDTFEQILAAKARSLRGMFNAADHRYDYLSNLSVISAGRRLDMSERELHDYLMQTPTLQLLSGLCFRKGAAEFMRSEIYFGNLDGNLPKPLLADLPISADELGAVRDMHTASILYALARDSKGLKADRDVTITYLGAARQLAAEIHTDGAVKLLEAIQAALNEAGAPARMQL